MVRTVGDLTCTASEKLNTVASGLEPEKEVHQFLQPYCNAYVNKPVNMAATENLVCRDSSTLWEEEITSRNEWAISGHFLGCHGVLSKRGNVIKLVPVIFIIGEEFNLRGN